MCREENIEAVLGKLKEKGCRITAQRRLLVKGYRLFLSF